MTAIPTEDYAGCREKSPSSLNSMDTTERNAGMLRVPHRRTAGRARYSVSSTRSVPETDAIHPPVHPVGAAAAGGAVATSPPDIEVVRAVSAGSSSRIR